MGKTVVKWFSWFSQKKVTSKILMGVRLGARPVFESLVVLMLICILEPLNWLDSNRLPSLYLINYGSFTGILFTSC